MRLKVALLSSGLGYVFRGFEGTTSVLFDEIKKDESLDVRLFSGGKFPNATTVWNFPRDGKITSLIKFLRLAKDGIRLEQISFSAGFLLHLLFYQPNVILLQEASLANMLLKFRKIFGFKYKIVFCDGAPVGHQYAKRFDYIIFLHESVMTSAVEDGVEAERCIVIPLITFPPVQSEKTDARNILNIDLNKLIIVCVAAWNRHHKRIDYLLEEIAQLNDRNITLLLCGQAEKNSESLKKMAVTLNIDAKWHTFNREDLSIAYSAADIFVLPSLNEGLGMVMIEAAQHKLPVICHDHAAGRFIFGQDYLGLTDLSMKGNLSKKITYYKDFVNLKELGLDTEKIVNKKFDRHDLAERFIGIIKKASLN